MSQTLASVEYMLNAVDEALADRMPAGGWVAQSALDTLSSVVGGHTAQIASRALTSDLTALNGSLTNALNSEATSRAQGDADLLAQLNVRTPGVALGAPGGLTILGPDGKLPNSVIPSLAVSDVWVVNSQAEMVALSNAGRGDFAVRTDLVPAQTFILTTDVPTTPSNWRNITPPGAVSSVDGLSGAVQLGSTSAVADSLARRLSDGRLQAAAGTSGNDLVTWSQYKTITDNLLTTSQGLAQELLDRAAAVTNVQGQVTSQGTRIGSLETPVVVPFTPGAGYTTVSGYYPPYYVKSGGMVTVTATLTPGSVSGTLITLPTGFRPPGKLFLPALCQGGGTNSTGSVVFQPDGTVIAFPNAGVAVYSFSHTFPGS